MPPIRSLRERVEDPESDKRVSLIVGVTDSNSEGVLEEIRRTGAEIEEQLFYDYLAVSILERDLSALEESDVVDHIEIEGEAEPLEGNFNSQSATIQ